MNRFFKMPEKINWTRVLTLIAPTLIFLGVLRLWSYYYLFNVDIVSFLDFEEILTSFLEINIIVTGLLPFPVILWALTIFYSLLERKMGSKKASIVTTLSGIAIGISVFIYFNTVGGLNIVEKTLLMIFVLTTSIVLLYFNMMVAKRKYFIPDSFLMCFLSILIFGLVTIGISLFEVSNVKYNHLFEGTTVEIANNEKIVSTDHDYYIGKTNNFVFVFHEELMVTDIIPVTQIKMITMKRKKYFFKFLR